MLYNFSIPCEEHLAMEKKKNVFIGNSLTEYFNWQQCFPDYHVINVGSAGETVEGLRGRMDGIRKLV